MAGYPFCRKADSILDLPDDLLFSVCRLLPLTDLVNVRLVCSVFKDVVDSPRHVALWTGAPLADLWPESANSYNMGIIIRAAKSGNVEAMLKLAVAYLYCEGMPECAGKGTLDSVNGATATEWLLKAEGCCEHWQPFLWVLIRPPWSPHGVCCKACVHLKLKELVDRGQGEFLPRIPYLIGKTLSFHEDSQQDEAVAYYRMGMERDCPFSTYEYLKLQQPLLTMDVSSMRLLRASASLSRPLQCWDAQLDLCRAYASGNFGGISEVVGVDFVRQMLHRSQSSYSSKLQKGITINMRYILVDWLFEVAEMKEFPPETVHLAVSLVDRYLQLREVKRTKLQLVGISAILLSARWMGQLIITIREAAWLTDNTYKYEQVVRMMGEVLAVFRGDLRKPTLVDYVDIILKFAKVPELTRNVALYLSEFALLHLNFLTLKPSYMAAAIVLLATIITEENILNTWPQVLINITGYTSADLAQLCIDLHVKCFVEEWIVKDHRNIELKAVKHRFSVSRFMEVSKMEVMSVNELKTHLGLYSEDELHMSCVFECASDNTPVVSVANLSISETDSPACTADSMMESGHKTGEAEQGGSAHRDYTPCGEMEHSTLVGESLSRGDSPSLRPPPKEAECQVVEPSNALATTRHNRLPLQNIANQQRKTQPGGVKYPPSAALKSAEYTRRVRATDNSQTKSEAK